MVTKLKKFVFGQNSGFSLIELLIVMSIISILTLLSLPSLQSFVQQQQLNHALRSWLTKIRLTRMRALKTGRLQTLSWQTSSVVTLNFRASFGRNQELVFLPSGFTQGQQGTLTICLKNQPDRCREVIILASGVVRQVLGKPV